MSAQLPFFKYAPSGNMTLFIPAAHVPRSERGAVARVLMRGDHLGAEQVGYIDVEASPPRLDMMGEELCVNACRAMAALLLEQNKLPLPAPPAHVLNPDPDGEGDWHYAWLASSGVDEALVVRARTRGTYSCEAAVCLPMAARPVVETLASGIRLVRLPGIAHLVLDKRVHTFPEDWRAASAALRGHFNLEHEEAVGCLWLCIPEDTAPPALPVLIPTVWVRATEDPQLETACGSGTLACALCLLDDAEKGKYIPGLTRSGDADSAAHVRVLQHKGEVLDVTMGTGPGGGWQAWIGGTVHCVATGACYLPDSTQHE